MIVKLWIVNDIEGVWHYLVSDTTLEISWRNYGITRKPAALVDDYQADI